MKGKRERWEWSGSVDWVDHLHGWVGLVLLMCVGSRCAAMGGDMRREESCFEGMEGFFIGLD